MTGGLLGLMATAWAGGAPDCALDTDGYVQLRRQLRKLARIQGHPVPAAGTTPQCDEAVRDVVRNDPLSGVRHSEGDEAAWDRVLGDLSQVMHCGALVEPDPGAWGFRVRTMGECTMPLGPGESPQRILSLGFWSPMGGSARWTEALGGGVAFLVDAAVQADAVALTTQQLPPWRALVGFDLSEPGLTTSMVVGVRLGLQDLSPNGLTHEESDIVGQWLLARRWVWGAAALQVGAGLMAESPVSPAANDRGVIGIGPTFELRLGIAAGR